MPEDSCNPSPERVTALRRALLRWYRENRRDLPWRADSSSGSFSGFNPYHTLVSEAMLQQTQVATVIPYFHRFIAAFPTVEDLSAAEEQRVLRLWQGLGYYRRARNLHAAARMIVERFDGQLPSAVEELLKLPGVGRYTAGAIASIAFNRRAPIVDGNVARVLSRWFAIEEPVDEPRTRERLWKLAEHLVPPRSPGDFNQGMMELGAMVCAPKSPACLVCPVSSHCDAHRRGIQDRLPAMLPKRKPKPVTHAVLAIEKRGRYLFEQRPADGLWSNMWQLPTREGESVASLPQWAADTLGLCIGLPERVSGFTHQTTHRTIRFTVHHASVASGRKRRGAWHRLDAVDDLPLPKPQLEALKIVREHRSA